MKYLITTAFLFIVLCCTMCKQRCQKVEPNDTNQQESAVAEVKSVDIDLYGEVPEKDLYLQDIADVRYVLLETTDKSLIKRISQIAMRDDKIIITDNSNHQVLIFDSIGNYLTGFSRKGSGPHEYMLMSATAVDFDSELIYIDDIYNYKVYDYDGYLMKKIPKHDYNMSYNIYVVGPEKLIAYYETNGCKEENDTVRGNYFLIDTNTGIRTPIGITIANPASNSCTQIEGSVTRSRGMPIKSMLKAGGEVIVSDYVYPTVFSCTKERLSPIVERTGKGVDDADSRYISSVYHVSDRYIIFRSLKVTGEHDIDRFEISDVRDFIYDRRTNTLMEGYIYNRDMDVRGACSLEAWGHDLPKNVVVQILSAEFLQSLNDRSRLSGPLKALVDTIDTDTNDILMIATLNK